MKRNGMCPICYVKQIFTTPKRVSDIYNNRPYDNGCALTPPMGWSSWNTFKNRIDQKLIYDTAKAMVDNKLVEAGYNFLNLDDNWHSSLRDKNGDLQGDLTTFSGGIKPLVEKINKLGIKVGIYSSNGTKTCEDLPASLGRERQDAYTFASWGIEYFKYDFCHNVPISSYAPLVEKIMVAKLGDDVSAEYPCADALLYGNAKLMRDKRLKLGFRVTGLDKNSGAMEFKNVLAEADGEYVLTVGIRKKGRYDKFLLAVINGEDAYQIPVPPQKHWNWTARFQVVVKLKKGNNTVRLFNPIFTRADSGMLQYQFMGEMLKEGAKRFAEESGQPVKPITFSLCEWGRNEPWKWGSTAGNLWRTTGDIFPQWFRVMMIYEKTVQLYKYAGVGGWNDPDMLEVGNGALTDDENVAHFSLWCMMASPLILGCDLRTITKKVLDIVTNKQLIAVNQDKLGKQAKRVKKGSVDVLAKPLADGSTALCFLNKGKSEKRFSFDLKSLISDEYVKLKSSASYDLDDLWSGEKQTSNGVVTATIPPHGVKVYKVK